MTYAIEHEGKAFLPDGQANAIGNVADHNKQVEQEEIAWLKTGPDRCFLYVKMGYPMPQIQTFLGTCVSSWATLGNRANVGFGFHSYRRSVQCRIFGVKYFGWFYESSGDYCKLRKAKRQEGA